MPSSPTAALAAVLTLAAQIAWAGEPPVATPPPDPAAAPGAAAPIDCPLHAKGVEASQLKPFAETEKYIEFLERKDRAGWQRPDELIASLHLAGGETVFDVGAGSGYFAFRFARALPKGRVVAVDVDPEMVRHVHHRVMSEGLRNLRVVLADQADPTVDATADLVFVCDVLHHVAGPEAWLRILFAEMKPGARLVLVEFKEGPLPQGPPEAMKLSRARQTALLTAAGFALASEDLALLPYQSVQIYQRPAR